jgi:hypothetical protein
MNRPEQAKIIEPLPTLRSLQECGTLRQHYRCPSWWVMIIIAREQRTRLQELHINRLLSTSQLPPNTTKLLLAKAQRTACSAHLSCMQDMMTSICADIIIMQVCLCRRLEAAW